MAKYDPLREHLKRAPHPVEMAFEEIARLVGGLPPTAHNNDAWWANNSNGHVQAAAWLAAGRRVTRVSLRDRRVRFS